VVARLGQRQVELGGQLLDDGGGEPRRGVDARADRRPAEGELTDAGRDDCSRSMP